MFTKNAAVTGFQIGHFVQIADGLPKTTGTPVCKRLLDGVAGTCVNAAAYNASAGVWEIDLAAADMNADLVGLSFTLEDCLPISYTIPTTVSLATEATVAAIKATTDAIDLSDTVINFQETVVGGDVTVNAGDTWRFTITDTDLDMSSYEVLAFVVKVSDRQVESQAQLYIRNDTGLQRINGGAPLSASNGTLTVDSATAFSVVVHMAETISVHPGSWYWWIKGVDTTPVPDEGATLASGRFTVRQPGVQAIA